MSTVLALHNYEARRRHLFWLVHTVTSMPDVVVEADDGYYKHAVRWKSTKVAVGLSNGFTQCQSTIVILWATCRIGRCLCHSVSVHFCDWVTQGWVTQGWVTQGWVTQGCVAQGCVTQSCVSQGCMSQWLGIKLWPLRYPPRVNA